MSIVTPVSTATTVPLPARVANSRGVSTLMYACQQGDVEKVRRILRAQPTASSNRDRTGKTPLHYCCTSDNIRAAQAADVLVMAAPDLIESRDEDGFTPLHLAVIAGNMPLVTFLLANNADVNAVDGEKHTVVHWATVCGETGALRAVLSAGAHVSTPDVHGGYPLHYAAQMCGGDKDSALGFQVLQALLQHPEIKVNVEDGDGRQPLLWAASAGSAKAALALIRAGAAVEASDKDGLTALHCAASRGHTDCIDTLLTLCGMSPDVIDSNGCTALHYSVTLGHADATALLLAHGADPNRQDRKGRCPAHCGCAKGQLETVKMIGGKGANLWLKNARGDFPLHEAAASGRRDLVKWLLEARPSQVNARNNDGRCPLHLAALNDNSDMCKIFLDAGAQVNPILRTSKNIFMTPLDCAMQRGFRSTAKYLQLHGGVPASRLGSIQNIKTQNSGIKLQIREDVTLLGESTDSERETGGKDEKIKRKHKRKFVYKLERKESAPLDSEKAPRKNPQNDDEKRNYDKSEENKDSSEHTSKKENITYSSEVKITNNYGGINIEKNGDIVISDTAAFAKSSADEKVSKSNKMGSKNDIKETFTKKKFQSTKTQSDTNNNDKIETIIENVQKKIGDIKPKTPTVISENIEEIKSLANTIEQSAKSITKEVISIQQNLQEEMSTEKLKEDQRSLMSFTSVEDNEENKKLLVEASVHEPPRSIDKTDTQKTEEEKIEIKQEESTEIEKIENGEEIIEIKEERIEAGNERAEGEENGTNEAEKRIIQVEEEIIKAEEEALNAEEETLKAEKGVIKTEVGIIKIKEEKIKTEEEITEAVDGKENISLEQTLTTSPELPIDLNSHDQYKMRKEESTQKLERQDTIVENTDSKDISTEEKEELTEIEAILPQDPQESKLEEIKSTTQSDVNYVKLDEEHIKDEEDSLQECIETADTVTADAIESLKLDKEKDEREEQIKTDEGIEAKETLSISHDSIDQDEDIEGHAELKAIEDEVENIDEIKSVINDKDEIEKDKMETNKIVSKEKIRKDEKIEEQIHQDIKKGNAEGVTAVNVQRKGEKSIKKKFIKEKKTNDDASPKEKKALNGKSPREIDRPKKVNKEKFDSNEMKKKSVNIKETLPKKAIERIIEVTEKSSPPFKEVDRHEAPVETSSEKYSDEEETVTTSSESSVSRKKHRSFTVLDGNIKSRKTSSSKHFRSRSGEPTKEERYKRSKIPTPVSNLKKSLSKSDRQIYKDAVRFEETDSRIPSLPNLHKSAPSRSLAFSDNERSASEAEDITRSAAKRKRLRKRMKRDSKSAGSDYESSNLIDSGFEPSPRSSRIPKWKNITERGVNMTSVTQTIQSNIRRYHLERKIFQHLLELKRLQIRSGQHNESVLVKRAIDEFHNSCASTVGAGRYVPQDYSFKSFEKFLYHSLRKLQKNGSELKRLPETPDNPLLCTQSTHRCLHATHAYTGIPCAAYLPKMDHHSIPKIGYSCKPSGGFLPQINPKKTVTLELCHGGDKQVISLPTDRLDQNKRYYVTFTVKGHDNSSPTHDEHTKEDAQAHRHSKSV